MDNNIIFGICSFIESFSAERKEFYANKIKLKECCQTIVLFGALHLLVFMGSLMYIHEEEEKERLRMTIVSYPYETLCSNQTENK